MAKSPQDGPGSLGRSIAVMYRQAQIFFTRELEPFGLGSSNYAILLCLYRQDGQSQEEVAANLGVDKAAIKRAVDDLVASGYLRREENESDRRAWMLRLTDLAHERRRSIKAVTGAWNRHLCEGLSPEEAARAIALLETMAANARLAAAGKGANLGS